MRFIVRPAAYAPFLLVALLVASTFAWAAPAANDPHAPFRDAFVDGSGRRGPSMIAIPAARFVMGSAPEEPGYAPREARHDVELSAYAIGQFEVTNEEFSMFLTAEGNQTEERVPWARVGEPGATRIRRVGTRFQPIAGFARHPVVGVTWAGARAYCRWLSARTGRFYHLPTEAQWEYAARAGTTTIWPWGDAYDPARLNGRDTAGAARTRPVGSFAANPWGLHDMLGNVWEWVLDAFDEHFYLYSPLRDPVLADGATRTPGIRGGGFEDGEDLCRPGCRANFFWSGNRHSIGFRVSRDGL